MVVMTKNGETHKKWLMVPFIANTDNNTRSKRLSSIRECSYHHDPSIVGPRLRYLWTSSKTKLVLKHPQDKKTCRMHMVNLWFFGFSPSPRIIKCYQPSTPSGGFSLSKLRIHNSVQFFCYCAQKTTTRIQGWACILVTQPIFMGSWLLTVNIRKLYRS